MTGLERELIGLGDELAYPPTPAVAPAVVERLAGVPAGARRPRRRALAVALALLAVAVGAVLSVPQARTAVLDFFGLRGATVTRVETLPAVPPSSSAALALGRPLDLGDDRRPLAPVPVVLVPAALGPPDAAYWSPAVAGGKLSLVYEPGAGVPRSRHTGVGLLVTQISAELEQSFVEKLAAGGTRVERLSVHGEPALWLEGGEHVVWFRSTSGDVGEDQARLAGNTLLLQRGDLLVRIEGEIDRGRAVELAESLRPVP